MNLKAGKWKWNKSLIFEKVNKIKASTRENNKLLVSEIRWGGGNNEHLMEIERIINEY